MAADHMVMTAEILAGGIAKTRDSKAMSTAWASTVRATLTSQLSAHVWLAGNALDTAVSKKGDLKDPQVVGARKALEQLRGTGQDARDRSTPTLRSRSSPPGGNTLGSSSTTPSARPPRTTKQVAKAKGRS